MFPPVPTGVTLEMLVNQEIVNPPKEKDGRIYQFVNCPNLLRAYSLSNRWYGIQLVITPDEQERTYWVRSSVIKFLLGVKTGTIYEIHVDVPKIQQRGRYFFTGCEEPDWPLYITSVILAHLETLKFSQNKPSGHPVLVCKIIRNYSPQIFEELL